MTLALPLLDKAQVVLIHMAPGMPERYAWVTALVVVILALAATIDAFTETVPESLIFVGLFAVTATQGLFTSWELAAWHLRQALFVGLLIWGINFAWVCKFHYDALGMGDAKWSMKSSSPAT